uniref:hypothetical protein n=1 Tax=uncultured Chitinophaga sp. TaxID=339340 RepID=UPI00261CEB8E
ENQGEGAAWSFTFDGNTAPIAPGEIMTKSERARKVKDSQKGITRSKNIPLMEFLFYKKDIGTDNKAFFDRVYDLFIQHFINSFKDPENPTIDELTDIIKTNLQSAAVVKELFRKALPAANDISIKESELLNMNTTALSLLHHNLSGNFHRINPGSLAQDRYRTFLQIYQIQKFDGTTHTKVPVIFNPYDGYGYDVLDYYDKLNQPNALLTSDSFLLEEADTEAFLRRYKHYWASFWLFQIPHHGSSHNSGLRLFAKLPHETRLFINYGVHKAWGGTWRHPSPKVITDIVAAGISGRLLAVNEHCGYLLNVEY